MRPQRLAIVGLALVLLHAGIGQAARLPVRSLTTADGLASDEVERVFRDSQGFLWVATGEGLSRFDGYRFESYGESDGLPSDEVQDVIETKAGNYWVATMTGLCSFSPRKWEHRSARSMFETITLPVSGSTAYLTVLRDDNAGGLWIGTGGGLLHLKREGDHFITAREDFGLALTHYQDAQVNALVEDSSGRLWVATRGLGVFRRRAAGGWDQWDAIDGLPSRSIYSLVADVDGHVWIGGSGGIARLRVDAEAHARPDLLVTVRDGLPSNEVRSLARVGKRFFAGTHEGLAEIFTDVEGGGARAMPLAISPIGATVAIMSLAVEHGSGLWMGTRGAGLFYLDLFGATRFGVEDGLESTRVVSFVQAASGMTCVTATDQYRELVLHRFDGARWIPSRVNLPSPVGGWGWSQLVVADRLGAWWFPTAHGAWRFRSGLRIEDLARAKPERIATHADGLPSDEIFRLWEDSRGDIWITGYGTSRWRRASGRIDDLKNVSGFDPMVFGSAFAEDHEGHVWIGDFNGGLLHLAGSRFEHLTEKDGIPKGTVYALHVDRRGRLWIGTSQDGAARLDVPDDRPLRIRYFRRGDGLSSHVVAAITEDNEGRIYLAGGRGVDRVDPDTDRVEKFDATGGSGGSLMRLAVTDRDGVLWFASTQWISRIVPGKREPIEPPAVRLLKLRLSGEPLPIAPLGVTQAGEVVLDERRRRLEVEFAAIDAAAGASLRYEHRLTNDEEWSAPSPTRSAELVNLSPGRYRFEVRAVAPDGRAGPAAAIDLLVRPPVWQRPQVVGAVIVMLGLIAWWVHRRRLARALELERIRTRIATDLHDDLGSTLSQIAIVSEVVRRRLPDSMHESSAPLARIAASAREAVESLADIVWSVDPRMDRLDDLVERTRRFAEEMAFGGGLALTFTAPSEREDRVLAADVRRALFLAAKESLNNAARHSGCRNLSVSLALSGDRLVLEVRDDGRGFDATEASAGHGLKSLRQRAKQLGGECKIESNLGVGTRVVFAVPLVAHLTQKPV